MSEQTAEKKLSPSQQKALDAILACPKPFIANAPQWMGRFGTQPASFIWRNDKGYMEDIKGFNWITFEALVKRGYVVPVYDVKTDATGRVASIYVPNPNRYPDHAHKLAQARQDLEEMRRRGAVKKTQRWVSMLGELRKELHDAVDNVGSDGSAEYEAILKAQQHVIAAHRALTGNREVGSQGKEDPTAS